MLQSHVVVFLVGAFAFENHVAGEAVVDDEAELALVDDVLLRPEVDQELLGQELLLVVIHGDRGHAEASWHDAQRQSFALEYTT